ncbi:unnamed protein product [Phaedon cochleariae]|uniref:Uncharacterized protein n=1 Tax=Phaedon cochleariae TaxID=80249 RepID=A0A9P0DI43_PHACE|nr:unnamed protein product [Phaedon cochleariae]
MKIEISLIVIAVTVVCAIGENNEVILASSNRQNEDGYHFGYKTSGGQEREENGVLDEVGDNPIFRVTGFYSYLGSDDKRYRVEYHADETGYNAREEVIPRPVPGLNVSSKESTLEEMTLNQTVESSQSTTESGGSEATGFELTTPVVISAAFPPAGISSAAIASLAGGGIG